MESVTDKEFYSLVSRVDGCHSDLITVRDRLDSVEGGEKTTLSLLNSIIVDLATIKANTEGRKQGRKEGKASTMLLFSKYGITFFGGIVAGAVLLLKEGMKFL